MISKTTLFALLVTIMTVGVNAITYDKEFWDAFDEEKPYEHKWKDIPDLINKTDTWWWFNETHHFLLGVERGMYNNDSLVLSPDCFGEKYLIKINEFAAMVQSESPWESWMQMIGVIYQLYYMGSEKCTIDKTLNDVYLYCWNDGCRLDELWGHTEKNFLYMTRAIIDAAIVWYEGIPESEESDLDQWHRLARQTGESVSEIIKQFINFTPQHGFKMKPLRDDNA